MKLIDLFRPKQKLVKVHGSISFVVKGVSFTMVPVEGGTFTMGTPDEKEGDEWKHMAEKPLHKVTISSFYICQTQVTQKLWKAVMGDNPSYFHKMGNLEYYSGNFSKYYRPNLNRPVEFVTWDQCQLFIKKLNSITGKSFRLPTEAEWEYAARGGCKSKGYKYSGSNEIDDVAWYWKNSGKIPFSGSFKWDETNKYNHRTHPVAKKRPNELGIYDMSGNVWEYCYDFWGDYSNSPQINPTGPESGNVHVCRGGSWFSNPISCRVSSRDNFLTEGRNYKGLRLAL